MILEKANEYYKNEDWYNAQALYELAVQSYRGKSEAEAIYFNYADTYYKTGEYITASHYFKTFASTYTNSPKREEAEFLSAYSNYKLSPNYKLDQSYTKKAVDAFQEFINNHPESKRVSECNQLIDEMRAKMEKKAFAQGQLYYDIGQFQSAVRSFELLLREYPDSKDEEKAKYLMLKSSFELAKNSVVEKREERYSDTAALARKYKDKFKNSDYVKEAEEILTKALSHIKNDKV